ncbi:MAG: hypothetical protein HY360_13180 [Verrucomicrobia bacterium]|nr:hypothetical protein [Verrucomicrobiota bacterium]
MIATDVFSEGLNLQDANCVINYDIHWNPVRLIQRIGRIDRIGSEHDAIHVFNFMPSKEIERELHLREKVLRRINEFQETIGADSQHFDKTEKVNDKAMYFIYDAKDYGQLELFEEDPGTFSLSEAEELIRDLEKNDPALMAKVKALPDGVRSARGGSGQTFAFFEARRFKQLWLADAEGRVVDEEAERVVAAIRCEKDEPQKPLPKSYNEQVNRLFQQFKQDAAVRAAQLEHTTDLSAAQRYLIRELNVLYRETQDANLKGRIEPLEKFARSDPAAALLKEYREIRKQNLTGPVLVERLAQLYFRYSPQTVASTDGQGSMLIAERIICSEAFI